MRPIVRWCLRNRSVVLVATALVVVAGVFGATQLRQQYFPDADLPFLVTSVEAPGLDAEQVDDQLAVPVDQAARGVAEVEETRTISNQGRLTMLTELAYGADTDAVEEDLQAALDEITLPAQAERPSIEGGFTDQAILIVALSTDGSLVDLTQRAEDVQEELEDVDGVDRIEVEGGARRELEVTLKPRAIRSGVTPASVVRSLDEAVQAQPLGLVEGGGASTPLTIDADEIESVGRLRSFSVGEGRELGDVARVRSADGTTAGFARTNGKRSVSLSLFKDEQADEVAVIDEAERVLDAERGELGEGNVTTIFQTASDIRTSINGLLLEGTLGALFAVLVIFFFLRSPRATVVAAVAIPTSIVFGLLSAWLLGLTVNIITLAGLTIAVGRVIDDAIVVLENIYKHLERGDSRSRAAIEGTSEVATAVASSTLATAAVFLPLGLVGGLISEIFLSFSIIVAVALLASLLVSVTLVPVLAASLLRPRATEGGGARLSALVGRITRLGLRHRLVTIALAIVLFVGTIAVVGGGAVPIQFLPDSGTQQLTGEIELPPGTSSERAERLLAPLEREVADAPGILDSQVSFGEAGLSLEPDDTEQGGTLFASFEEGADVPAAVEGLRRFGTAEYPDGFSVQQVEQGPPAGEFEAIVRGGSVKEVEAVAASFTDLLERRPDVAEVENEADRRQRQLVVELDRDAVGTPDADAARAALASVTSTAEVSVADGDTAIVLEVPPRLIDDPEALEDLRLSTEATGATGSQPEVGQSSGAPVAAPPDAAPPDAPPPAGGTGAPPPPTAAGAGAPPPGEDGTAIPPDGQPEPAVASQPRSRTVGDVGEVRTRQEAAVRSRVGGDVAVTVTARVLGADTNRTNSEVEQQIDELDLDGATIEIGGDQEFIDQMFSDLGLAMVAAICLVYVVLLVFFGSAGQPLTILAPILFSTIGSLLALVITRQALGLPAMIGQLLLIGIVVANSILLVDTALRLRRSGVERDEALVRAARRRARPVFMTAVATIAALMPLAVGISGEGGIISRSLGSVVVGGLLTATLLTLVIVPAVFTIFDRGRRTTAPPSDGSDQLPGDGDSATDGGPDGAARAPQARSA